MISTNAYAEHATSVEEARVLEQLPLVKRIALHLLGSMPAGIEADDLIQAGMLGLLAAARDYSPDHGATFSTYAGIRIRGAILDEVRQLNWAPRSVQKKAQMLSRAERAVTSRLGDNATDQDFATELGVDIAEYHDMVRDVASGQLVYLEDEDPEYAQSEGDPAITVSDDDLREAVAGCIEELPERERLFMALYYQEELNLKEIGEVLGVSESRACQIHGQALSRIREKMHGYSLHA
ncbi:MAG: RNA polymerase sigma factor FliA [Pseudomonadales bacterium]|nr:RNA polymerase sigma factor FliA [Pseudomonadales bacterium]